ncbi:MAG: hypothetical protein ABFS38_14195 [Bacteroidota bacterium]
MNQKIREIAGSLISVGILIFYFKALWQMVEKVKGWIPGNGPVEFSDGTILLATGLGGLVSAVVITTLGISKPGKAPTGAVQELSKDFGQITMAIIAIAYVGVWLFLGGYAAIYGVIRMPDASSTLHEMGIAWFGLLLGAGYAYFGINPPK